MIQVFAVTVPLGDRDGDAVCATLQAATDKLMLAHPALRSAAVAASEGVLTMTLRVTGRDRWKTSRVARKIATNMLKRVGIGVGAASMELVYTPATASFLTKDQVESGQASADPS